jgi:hypothetical protein
MARPDLNIPACVNPVCQLFDQPGAGNLRIRKVYGQDQIRLLGCCQCKEEFSERCNTPLFNTKIPEAKAVSVIEHLDESCSIRATAKLVKVSKGTVARLLKGSGRHAQKLHDQRVRGITPQALEFDEQWSFVKKKQRRCSPRKEGCGDMWDHVAIDPKSKLVVALEVGKRTEEQTR